MAETLPVNFPLPNETAVVSYPYSDIQEGTGMVRYYGASQKDASVSYILTTQTLQAQNPYESVGSGASGSTEYNFNLAAYKTPKTISGAGFLNLTVEGAKNAEQGFISIAARVIKYDGSTETALCSSTSQSVTIESGETSSHTVLIPLTLTQTHFKIGDILRLELILTWTVTAGAFTYIRLGADPANRHVFTTTDHTNSTLSLYVPFRLTL